MVQLVVQVWSKSVFLLDLKFGMILSVEHLFQYSQSVFCNAFLRFSVVAYWSERSDTEQAMTPHASYVCLLVVEEHCCCRTKYARRTEFSVKKKKKKLLVSIDIFAPMKFEGWMCKYLHWSWFSVLFIYSFWFNSHVWCIARVLMCVHVVVSLCAILFFCWCFLSLQDWTEWQHVKRTVHFTE